MDSLLIFNGSSYVLPSKYVTHFDGCSRDSCKTLTIVGFKIFSVNNVLIFENSPLVEL